jgi:hypothetical protein
MPRRDDGFTAAVWRAALVAGLAVIVATGVYAQLVAAHAGSRPRQSSRSQEAAFTARIEVAAHTVADLGRRLGQIDTAIAEAGPTPPCQR